MNYYVAIGTPKSHSGHECEIEAELQIGDFAEFWDEENKDDDNGYLIKITHRHYCSMDHSFTFYGKKV